MPSVSEKSKVFFESLSTISDREKEASQVSEGKIYQPFDVGRFLLLFLSRKNEERILFPY